MTETTVIALASAFLAAIPPTIMAYAALLQGRSNATKAEIVNVKTDSLIDKTTEIHTLTNGTLSKVSSELGLANQKILGLEKLMAQIAETKHDTAITQAELLRVARAAPAEHGDHDAINDDPLKVEVVNTPLSVTAKGQV